MQQGVYLILNTTINKGYVGSSSNVENRWQRHKWQLGKGRHENPILQADWDKFGSESFTFAVLEALPAATSLQDRAARERHHMEMQLGKLGELYNMMAVRPAPVHPTPSHLWLSVPTIAAQLNVTEKTVHNWIDSGKLEAREEYHGQQRRRYVAYSVLETFKATLPSPPTATAQ